LRGVQQKWATGPYAASWSLSRQSSQDFSKDALLAEILNIPIWEFFNKIGSKRSLSCQIKDFHAEWLLFG